MMKKFQYFIFVIIICLHKTHSVEENTITMYDTILQNCSLLKACDKAQLESFQSQSIFNECVNWTAINSMRSLDQLSENNKGNIRCLLFYETFNSLCKRLGSNLPLAESKKFLDLVTSKLEHQTIDIDTACNSKLSLLPEKPPQSTQYINDIVKDKRACDYLCEEYLSGVSTLNDLCAISYSLNILNFKHPDSVSTDIGNIDAHPNISHEQIEQKLNGDGLNHVPVQNIVHQSVSVKMGQEVSSMGQESLKNNHVGADVLAQVGKGKIDQSKPAQVELENIGTAVEKVEKNVTVEVKNPLNPVIETDIDPSVLDNAGVKPEETNAEKAKSGDTSPQVIHHPNVQVIPVKSDTPKNINDQLDDNVKKAEADEKIINEDNQKIYEKYITNSDQQQQPPSITKIDSPGPNIVPEYEEDMDNLEKPDEIIDQKVVQPKKPEAVMEEAVPDRFKAPVVSRLNEQYPYEADMDGNSYFFTYFSFTCVAFILGYVGYHNKQKVLAILLEGRNPRRSQRGRRPNSANYHKLDSNLEEAISSSCSKNTSHIIY